ncbi:hypothetical protein J4436_00190 [Candidatus Woesearchaeota archaeon]|nr:hypothetical protein [Candidatus Woesearchaeota archaeon]
MYEEYIGRIVEIRLKNRYITGRIISYHNPLINIKHISDDLQNITGQIVISSKIEEIVAIN